MAATHTSNVGPGPLVIKSTVLGDISLSVEDGTLTEMSVITFVKEMLEELVRNGALDDDVDNHCGLAQTSDGTSGSPSVMKDIGVVTYFLLCGRHPFQVNDSVRRQEATFAEAAWQSSISVLALDFVKSLFDPTPPSFKDVKSKLLIWKAKEPMPRLDRSVSTVLRNLAKYSTFQQWALKGMKKILTKKEIESLYENQFKVIDLDSDGKITKAELASALQGHNTLVAKVDEIHKAMDNNRDEVVEFKEFEEYISHSSFPVAMRASTKQLIKELFSKLDKDGDQYITALELQGTVLEGDRDRVEMITTWIAEADKNGDGVISLPEFEDIMIKSLTGEANKNRDGKISLAEF